MGNKQMVVVVMPAYKPDQNLNELVSELTESGLSVLVVNDGSGKEYDGVFAGVSDKAKVIGFEENHGKGSALKLGFSKVRELYPECTHVITADSDGQHRVSDILRVRDELEKGARMVLTVRRLKGKIPARSKFGNNLSKLVYTMLTGHYFSDNQSGLRGFSAEDLEWLVRVKGDRYDYEMNVLYCADKQSVPITTMMIETIYIDGNKSSHFNPVKDTVRIYKSLFTSAAASFIGFAVCELFVLIAGIIFRPYVYMIVPTAGALAALICILINKFIIFKRFRYRDGFRMIISTIIKYGAYTVLCMLLGFWLPDLPLILIFNLVLIVSIPFEYLIRKGIHASEYRDINKE